MPGIKRPPCRLCTLPCMWTAAGWKHLELPVDWDGHDADPFWEAMDASRKV